MSHSSILGGDRAPQQAPGRDSDTLGPSDTSDSGSDIQGELELASPLDPDNPTFGTEQPGLDSESDAGGTGERGAAVLDEEPREASDILPDDVRSLADEADEAEDVSVEAELELAELTDGGDVPALDEDDDEIDENE